MPTDDLIWCPTMAATARPRFGTRASNEGDVGVCCCIDRAHQFNFARPGRYEACAVTQASLYAAAAFWIVSLCSALSSGNISIAVVEVFLEAVLDFASTAVVLYRLSASDALRATPRNEIIEKRVSVLLGLTMVALGALLVIFSVFALASTTHVETPGETSLIAVLALPSALIYIVIGMMQLQMAWILELRSLKQDAIISILGAIVSVGALTSALCNLILWVNSYDSAAWADGYSSQDGAAPFGVIVINSTDVNATHRANNAIQHMAQIHNQLWWMEDAFTIITAACLILAGVFFLAEDTLGGNYWWTATFWLAPLPPKADPTGAGGETKDAAAPVPADEQTPLKDPKKPGTLP